MHNPSDDTGDAQEQKKPMMPLIELLKPHPLVIDTHIPLADQPITDLPVIESSDHIRGKEMHSPITKFV
jgi:hypothetical protein